MRTLAHEGSRGGGEKVEGMRNVGKERKEEKRREKKRREDSDRNRGPLSLSLLYPKISPISFRHLFTYRHFCLSRSSIILPYRSGQAN